MKFSRVVAVVGFKESGKTRVVEGLVRELTKRGYRVGTAKHIGDPDFTIDREGRDTWKHAGAGAKVILCVANNEFVRIEKGRKEIQKIVSELQDRDFFVLEGFRELDNVARIAVLRDPSEAEELVNRTTLASVGAEAGTVPRFSFNDMVKLANLVDERAFPPLPGLNCERCGYRTCGDLGQAIVSGRARWDACAALKERTSISVDGTPVPLNPFVQNLVASVVKAIVASLKQAHGKRVVIEVNE